MFVPIVVTILIFRGFYTDKNIVMHIIFNFCQQIPLNVAHWYFNAACSHQFEVRAEGKISIPVTFRIFRSQSSKTKLAVVAAAGLFPPPVSAAKAGRPVADRHSLCGLRQSQTSHFPPPPKRG